jgi:hypothetical protein
MYAICSSKNCYKHIELNVYTSLDKAWISAEEFAPPAPPLDLNGLATILKKTAKKGKKLREKMRKGKYSRCKTIRKNAEHLGIKTTKN